MILYVALGAGLGSLLRYLITEKLAQFAVKSRLAIFAINISGCFFAGLISSLILPRAIATILLTGFCGGYTTFSTLMAETLKLVQAKARLTAICYCLGSCVLGLFAIWLGLTLGRLL